MKRFRFQILFFLRKSRKPKSGKYPIYLRVTINGEKSSITTGRSVKSRNWNSKQGRVRISDEDAEQINDHLKFLGGKVFEAYTNIESQGHKPTAKSVIDSISGRGDTIHTLLSVYEYHNKMMADKVGKSIAPGSYKNHRLTFRHLKQFIPIYCHSKDIPLNDLNGQFITEFEHFLRTVKDNRQNGAMKNLVRLKKIIRLAITNDWTNADPFRNYKIRFKKTDRVYLNEDELERFESVDLLSTKLQKVRDIFVFSCHTGLAYVDIKSFNSQNIIIGVDGSKWIIGKRGKSGIRYTLPLLPKAKKIFQKYNLQQQIGMMTPIFPVMSSQKMNQYLKEIAKLAGITKPISFHSARHTFATTVTLVNGVPIETVSKMLGHVKISTTQIYARVIDQKIATDMNVLMEKLKKKQN